MKTRLPTVLIMVVALSLMALAPVSADAPLKADFDLEFNLAWPGPGDVVPDWVGPITIDGEEYDIAFFYLDTGKPFAEDHLTGAAGFFGEIWRIYDGLEYEFEDGMLTEFTPGTVVLWGYDTGVVSPNSKYRMNGTVEGAAPAFEGLIGANVHMSGEIIWYESGPFAGAPHFGPGSLHIN